MTSLEDKVNKNLEEYMKTPIFMELTNNLSGCAGYLIGEDLTDFRRDIVRILAIHSIRNMKFSKVEEVELPEKDEEEDVCSRCKKEKAVWEPPINHKKQQVWIDLGWEPKRLCDTCHEKLKKLILKLNSATHK